MPGFEIGEDKGGMCGTSSADGGGTPAPVPRDVGRAHRYEVEILGGKLDFTTIKFYANKVTRPTIEIDRITVHHGQDEIYRPGKQRWQPIDITFSEAMTENRNTTMVQICKWRQQVIDLKKSQIGKLSDLYATVNINVQDAGGKTMWSYTLINAWPMGIMPSTMSYADTSLSEVTVKVSMDKVMEKCDEGSGGGNDGGSSFPPSGTDSERGRQLSRQRNGSG